VIRVQVVEGMHPEVEGCSHLCDTDRMEQRLSLVTLGVNNLQRARAFYEALGWRTNAKPDDDVVFFQAGGMIVALWDRGRLAEDTVVSDQGGWGGITLAHNVSSRKEVDAILEEAKEAGATIARLGAETFWGGYSGVFSDPDGHPWEIAHNPFWTLREDGSISLSSPD
jgi:predicted lactoylglutathione lyase